MADTVAGQDTQEGLSFYADREIIYYKQFIKDGQLDTEKLSAYGFNERQIPQIQVIAQEQGWLVQAAAVPQEPTSAFSDEE